MKQKNKLMLITAILLVFTTILTACQTTLSSEQVKATMESAVNATMTAMPTATTKPTATVIPTPVPTPTTAPVQYGPTNFPDNVDPLTGLAVSDPSILNRRPVMVKVANFPRYGRPHAGLSYADIVFSYYIAPAENRFLALYYGQDSTQVGPIRSGRYIDRWLVYMYQGVLAFVSAWPPELTAIYNQLGNRAFTYGENNKAFFTVITNDPSNPNYVARVMANTAEMSQYYAALSSATNTKPDLDGMAFSSDIPSGGANANEVTMQWAKSCVENWRFDPKTNKYFLWTEEQDINRTDGDYALLDANGNAVLIPLTDRDNGQQLSFSNVIIMWAEYQSENMPTDTVNQVMLPGSSGKMLLYRDGQVFEGKWKGVKTDGPIQFIDANGNPMQLQPGNSWITITGKTSTVQQDTPGVWNVVFSH